MVDYDSIGDRILAQPFLKLIPHVITFFPDFIYICPCNFRFQSVCMCNARFFVGIWYLFYFISFSDLGLCMAMTLLAFDPWIHKHVNWVSLDHLYMIASSCGFSFGTNITYLSALVWLAVLSCIFHASVLIYVCTHTPISLWSQFTNMFKPVIF